MPLKINQIVENPRIIIDQTVAPTTGANKGSFFPLNIGGIETEAAYADEAGNITQISDGGVLYLNSNSLTDLGDVNALAPANGQVLTWDSGTSKWIPSTVSGGGSGETNTASNLGTGEGVFALKSGVDLQFKSLIAGTNVTLSSDANGITINSTGGGGSATWTSLGALDTDIVPDGDGTRTIGADALRLQEIYVDRVQTSEVYVDNTGVQLRNLTSPSGVSGYGVRASTPALILTGSGEADVLIETANRTGGGESSGDISIRTGTTTNPANRGKINLVDASLTSAKRNYRRRCLGNSNWRWRRRN